MAGTAIVLAGHGSHISPDTAGLIWHHVDELRALNIVDEVTAAFWKETPSFHTVFNSLEANDITVIPVFTAQGYFTQTVIPAEMGLTGAITERDGRTIRYTKTLSEHPYLGQVVRQRVEEAKAKLSTLPIDDFAIAIIGHSTKRNPESRKATEAQAETIRKAGLAKEVVAVYLDDEPQIQEVYKLTSAPHLIVVPYFLAMGSHVRIDVPQALGLHQGSFKLGINPHERDYWQITNRVHERQVHYMPPVGIGDDLRGALLELAREAGTPMRPPHAGSRWDCFPKANAWIPVGLVQKDGIYELGQLRISAEEVRQIDDFEADRVLDEPWKLRDHVRNFRPLATKMDLPSGWRVLINGDFRKLSAVIETVYPGALGLFEAKAEANEQRFEDLLQRQTGQYQELTNLTATQKTYVIDNVCRVCVKHPLWTTECGEPKGYLHCPEPCDFWLSTALTKIKVDETE